MKVRILLFLFFLPISLIAQDFSNEASDSLEKILDLHKIQLQQGDINSLRYLGKLLDDPTRMAIQSHSRRCFGCRYWSTVREEAYERIEDYILFKDFQFTDSTFTQPFLTFLSTSNIRFSYFINRFIDAPLEEHEIKYRLKAALPNQTMTINEAKTYIKNELKERNSDDFHQILDEIAHTKTPAARRFLLEYYSSFIKNKKNWQLSKSIKRTILYGCLYYEDQAMLDTLLALNLKYRDDPNILEVISILTNFDITTRTKDPFQFQAIYHHLLDSLGSLKALQTFGYQQQVSYSITDFAQSVDYYGTIFYDKNLPTLVKYRALRDLLKLKDPKLLKYLGGQGFYTKFPSSSNFHSHLRVNVFYLMTQLTDVRLEFPKKSFFSYEVDTGWVISNSLYYPIYWYKTYWHNHYQDYVWSETEERFKNIKTPNLRVNQIDTLFSQLKSLHKTTVLKAFQNLTEVRIPILQPRIPPYNNSSSYDDDFWINKDFAPDKAEDLIIALSKFTNYCQDNNINYRPTQSLQASFDQLLSDTLTVVQSYNLENKLAQSLTFDEVNALEWLLLIYQKDNHFFKYSIHRILDIWYMKNWETVIVNQKNMIWYLKKSIWMNKFVSYNIYYHGRWKDNSPSVYQTLKTIHDETNDHDLQNALRTILPKSYISSFLSLPDLFNHLDQIDLDDIKNLRFELSTPKDYDFIFQQLAQHRGEDTLLFIFNILSDNLKPELTPYLLQQLDDHHIIYTYRNTTFLHRWEWGDKRFTTVSDQITLLLEQLYSIKFPTDDSDLKHILDSLGRVYSPTKNYYAYDENRSLSGHHWKKVAQRYPADYQNWGKRLYQERIQAYLQRDSISYQDLNTIFQSRYYSDSLYEILLPLFSKFDNTEYFHELELPHVFIQNKTITELEKLAFVEYTIEDIPEIFRELPLKVLLPIIQNNVQRYSLKAKASAYYFLLTDLDGWWKSAYLMDNFRDTILQVISQYTEQNKDDLFFKFDEILFFFHHYQLPLEDQLEAVAKIKEKSLSNNIYAEMLYGSSYDELSILLSFYQKHPNSVNVNKILNDQFNIYIPDFTDDLIPVLIKNIQTMDLNVLRLHYLRQIGIEIELKNSVDNYKKIYQHLKFSYNRDYSSMLMAVLETHFDHKMPIMLDYPSNLLEEDYQLIQWLIFFKQNSWVHEALKNRSSSLEIEWEWEWERKKKNHENY